MREGDEQKKYVQGINGIIKEDGYELYISSQKSGVPHYSIGKRRIVEGELKISFLLRSVKARYYY